MTYSLITNFLLVLLNRTQSNVLWNSLDTLALISDQLLILKISKHPQLISKANSMKSMTLLFIIQWIHLSVKVDLQSLLELGKESLTLLEFTPIVVSLLILTPDYISILKANKL